MLMYAHSIDSFASMRMNRRSLAFVLDNRHAGADRTHAALRSSEKITMLLALVIVLASTGALLVPVLF